MGVFTSINKLGNAIFRCSPLPVKDVLAETCAHIDYPIAMDLQCFLELLTVALMEDKKAVIAATAFDNAFREMRTKLHLSQACGMAVGNYWRIGSQIFQQGTQQPNVMAVNEMRLEI